jgi:alpha-amylase
MFAKITFASALAMAVSAGTSDEWKQRSVYQVLTDRFARSDGSTSTCTNLSNYCGGDYQGMINKLDYIQGMGYDAIWISPIVDNSDGGYHGYWARDWEAVNSNFGSKDDLKALVDAAHAKGIWVMVDVVANHTAPIGTDYGQLNPFNNSSYFHTDCQIVNWNDQAQVEYCRLADLPDLDQDNSFVRDYLKNWVKGIVNEYGFDGIRIDTIPEVSGDFWKEYGESAGVFQMGECFNGDPSYVGPYQYDITALFNYPMYYTIGDVFGSHQSMYGIKNRYDVEDGQFKDVDLLGVFVDNHDNPRFLSRYSGEKVGFRSAMTFSLTSRGIPFSYYGSEQYYAGGADPKNRESLWQDYNTSSDLYQQIAAINAQRKASQIWNEEQVQRYADDSFYSFSRGKFLTAFTNSEST